MIEKHDMANLIPNHMIQLDGWNLAPEVHLVRGEPEEGVDDGGGGDVVKVAQLLRPHPRAGR